MENTDLLQAIRSMIQEEIQPIKEEITTIKSDMGTLKSDMGTLKSDMDTIKADTSALKSGMDTVKADISTIQSTMATKADITRLENKIEQYGEVQQKDIYHLLQLTSKKVDNIHEDLKSLAEVTGEHEMKIRSLARRPV
ncbi:hypothetical protein SPSIL_047250 [Sporomusa silvacetica DSM 10669]|uniref:Chromosome partition protein Smc n=2 Tax=Sporomusa silvacetica TaxID=55504 RepID=A0ABZ3ISV4_9FIRM|nr:hypothetical protein SPSIL_46450 [Sporomusa silvacetica DSM 10669]